ncbi:MAG: dTDP-4-dehydrorhamnose 3,5-epimerase [Candidatus Saccharimonas sp.]|nr:dTDP-4-dehydrorhamnose 3,5-epimerase [Planctomycetaceae bacterium]
MLFLPSELSGAWLIEPELISDERGSFARTWCAREFEERGLNPRLAQCNISWNHRQGTVRGMHFQREPHAEAKVVRCTRGAIYDVIVDLRPESKTFCQWIARELTAENRLMLYIPEGFAHGFQTLADDTEILYQMSCEHHSLSAAGLKWNDPAIAVCWPLPISKISQRDLAWPRLEATQMRLAVQRAEPATSGACQPEASTTC